jgi:hypothetical protein
MALLDRVRAAQRPGTAERDNSIDSWISDYLIPSVNTFAYGQNNYIANTLGLNKTVDNTTRLMRVSNTLPGYMTALKASAPAFAAQMVRALVLSQVRFTFRNPPWDRANPRKTLRHRRAGAARAALAERHDRRPGRADGVARRAGRQRVRPAAAGPAAGAAAGLVGALYGSELEPDSPDHALDGELLGYVYQNGGFSGPGTSRRSSSRQGRRALVADPGPARTPGWACRGSRRPARHPGRPGGHRVQGEVPDQRRHAEPRRHRHPGATREQFNEIVDMLEENHKGLANAYKTLYLTTGADAKVIGRTSRSSTSSTQGGGPRPGSRCCRGCRRRCSGSRPGSRAPR